MHKRFFILLLLALLTAGCKNPVVIKDFPTQTPRATATAARPPTATATPTALPTPTPIPVVRVEQADRALHLGDYEFARRDYQEALSGATDAEVKAAATLGMGRALYLSHNYSTAIDTLKGLVSAYPQSAVTANAYYFLARSYEKQKIYAQAAEAYQKFLQLRPGVLDAYIQEAAGDDYMAAGNPGAAASAYQASIQAPQTGDPIWTELKLGKAYAAMGDFSNAIQRYLDIYSKSNSDYVRAQANFLMGQAYLTMGEPEQAHARFLDSVASFPKSYDTYSGLVQLITDGVAVSELNRGIVDYYAGQYGLAIDAFNRYIATASAIDATPFHFRALSHLAKNEAELAIQDWDYIIANFPTDDLWPTAWEEKAYTQWAYLDQFDAGANTLLEYVQQAPQSASAPDFLFQAGRILERNNQFIRAAETWEQLLNDYPSAEQSYRALFLAGVTYFRAKDYPRSLTVFQRALLLGNTPAEQAAAYLWVGKSHQAQGNSADARKAWEQATQRDPTGYYSVRANELLQGFDPFVVSRPIDLGYDLAQERAQAEAWLRTTFSLPEGADLNGLGDLAADEHIRRGAAFWELGLYAEARDEFETLRAAVQADPAKTYRLMNYLLDLGVYRSAIYASRQILDLANLDDVGTLQAPAYFNHIRFGIYYKDQVLEASQSEDLHPLFLLSVLRQESMFEGFAQSGVGARGLMQIMPATGQEIVSSMSWPADYQEDDLYRPLVSIKLGARYLARQRDYFGANLFAALAAYNGGPGNTIVWKELAGEDPDLLLETIRADETRKYITQIYEFFNIYRLLYERGL